MRKVNHQILQVQKKIPFTTDLTFGWEPFKFSRYILVKFYI